MQRDSAPPSRRTLPDERACGLIARPPLEESELSLMMIARLRIQRFRGFESADLLFPGHAVIAGEPRAGRSDIVLALRRALDPKSTRARVNPLDIHRPAPVGGTKLLTEVEVTLLDLSNELKQLFDDYLEAFDPETAEVATAATGNNSVVGVRLCYRAQYDDASDSGEHWVDYPARSDVLSGSFRRVSRADREAIPVMFVDSLPPLQVRSEGAFRALIELRGASAFETALGALRDDVDEATDTFSTSAVIAEGVQAVLNSGAADLLDVPVGVPFELVTEDGTMAALLRSLQPALELDSAGILPISGHGSTTVGIFSAAEAVAAATQRSGDLVVVGDDFGDQLDSSAGEHMALLLHRAASQIILTTRREDVVRAFEAEQLIRLTRRNGARLQHRLGASDKSKRVTRRLALDQLMGALSARKVLLLEGPLDVEGYGALSTRFVKGKGGARLSFPANGIRLVSPPGSDGGIDRLKSLAELATELGFAVRVVVDSDKPGANDPQIAELLTVSEQVVVLPTRTAVEGALVRGIDGKELRKMVDALKGAGMPPLPPGIADVDISKHLIDSKILKKQGLHVAWVRALKKTPPIAKGVIEAACSDSLGRVDVADIP
jgi:putative ATP-dependent endonuclease of OLD family